MKISKIRELVEIVEKHDIEEIEISKWWGSNLRVSKSAGIQKVEKSTTTQKEVVDKQPSKKTTPKTEEQETEQQKETAEEEKEEAEAENRVKIETPIVGTFYRAPAPDADDFVEPGDTFQEGDTLCIIEAMKVMNEIEAEFSGKVIDVLVENSEPVEYEEPLFLVEKY